MKYGAMFVCGLVACVMALSVITRHAPASEHQDLSRFAMFSHPSQK